MLRRLESLFGPDARHRADSLFALIVSDYLAYYGPATRMRVKWCVEGTASQDTPRRLALLFLPRLFHNPCLHATLLLRLAQRSPSFTLGLWRTLLIAKHSIDISRPIEIGPGLLLPHPMVIGLGSTVRIGRDVTILNGVNIGGNVTLGGYARHPEREDQYCPALGDDVVVFANCVLVGPINIGERAVVGAGAWVDKDVPARTVHPGTAALFRQLTPG